MGNGIELQGIENFVDMIESMEITEEDVSRAIKKSMSNIKRYIEPEAPNVSGKTKKSIKIKLKKGDFAIQGVIYVGAWSAMFQEYRNTKQKGKYVGWFQRAIREGSDRFVEDLRKELLK